MYKNILMNLGHIWQLERNRLSRRLRIILINYYPHWEIHLTLHLANAEEDVELYILDSVVTSFLQFSLNP